MIQGNIVRYSGYPDFVRYGHKPSEMFPISSKRNEVHTNGFGKTQLMTTSLEAIRLYTKEPVLIGPETGVKCRKN